MKNKIKVVSLFCGIGGFETGFFEAFGKSGTELVLSSEIDPFAQRAYGTLYGNLPSGDVTKINESLVGDHDILAGGFPCQAFSQAGKRLGFKDTRGTLFFDIARIAKEKNPKWLLLENVKGLVNHDKGNTMNVIAKTLSELGYAVDFAVLNSARFAVPQNRERIFIVAKRDGAAEEWTISKEKTNVTEAKKRLTKETIRSFNFPFPKGETPHISVNDILEEQVSEKYFMNKPFELLEKKEIKEISLQQVARLDMKGNDSIRRVYAPEGLAPTLTTMGGGHREPKIYIHGRVRKLTPLECFRVQGFPDEYYHLLKNAGFSDSRLYKFVGNSVTPQVIAEIAKTMQKDQF